MSNDIAALAERVIALEKDGMGPCLIVGAEDELGAAAPLIARKLLRAIEALKYIQTLGHPPISNYIIDVLKVLDEIEERR